MNTPENPSADTPFLADDMTAPFMLPGRPVVGRLTRLGALADDILGRHDYPEPVADLLGEALALAALIGASLKFEGRLILQAQGDGPVSYVVADYDTSGAMRGYCKFDADRVAEVSGGFARPGARTLLGQGAFVLTLDCGPELGRSQGMTPIEGETLALCAETFFAQSEQIPTRVVLGVGRTTDGRWRAGGMLAQYMASDDARGSTGEAWDHARALMGTLGEDELVDVGLSPEQLLFRLFHEEGVRLLPGRALRPECRCSRERVEVMLKAFDAEDRAEMVEADGLIHVSCEYCSRSYDIAPDTVSESA